MAALIRHCTIGFSFLSKKNNILNNITDLARHNVIRHKQNWRKQRAKQAMFKSKWEWEEKALSSRGFLRPLKSYTPSADVPERFNKICESKNISSDASTPINNLEDKFHLMVACEQEFNYTIPSSILHDIETVGDIKKFYETPVNTTLPLDAAIKIDLPKNLHIETNYIRFHPDTDSKFNGKTAFPRSSTIVTGIKTRKKYPGLNLRSPFF